MSEQHEKIRYSSFWPMLIVLVGLSIWGIYQLYAVLSQRNAVNSQYEALEKSVVPAQNVQTKFSAVGKDLVDTAAKDPYAAQIVKEAVQAGIFHVNPSAPADSSSSTPPSDSK